MSDNHVAPGQALGYIYQFDRATFVLLSSENTVVEVGVEDIDDISIVSLAKEVREQDKSTIDSGNPLSDRSVALWKTLHIWIEDIKKKPEILKNTEFHLVTNGFATDKSIAKRINKAKTPEKAISIVKELIEVSKVLRDDLASFGESVSSLDEDLLVDLIQKIYVFDKLSPHFGGNLDEIQSLRYFAPKIKEQIYDLASGWIKRKIRELVENDKRPRIDKEEFDKEIKGYVRTFQIAPLLFLLYPQPLDAVYSDYESCGFVRQLDWIEVDESIIRDAVIHFVYAQKTRINWADASIISDTALVNYEEDLIARWRLAFKRIGKRSDSSLVERGQNCLEEVLKEDSTLDNQSMPKQFTCGSFHALADFKEGKSPRIGWHPNYKDLSQSGERHE